MKIRGAGGTAGGTGRFFLGLIMMLAGGYLFLNSIYVSQGFGLGHTLFALGGINVTGGLVLVPFIFGVGLIFYNSRNPLGWVLLFASLVMMAVGVIASIQLHFRNLSLFDLLMIITLFVGGAGLFLSSLKNFD